MIIQTYQMVIHQAVSTRLLVFVFFSTMCSYNFHWYLTQTSLNRSIRIQWTHHHKGWHLLLTIVSMVGAGISFITLSQYWLAMLFGAFVTFLYSAPKLPHPFFKELKRIAIGKTLFLAFVWMYVTTLLPVVVAGAGWGSELVLYALGRFFLIYAICILFDYRDRQDDKHDGIKSLVTLLGEKGINLLFTSSLLLFALTTTLLFRKHFAWFPLTIQLLPGVITGALYPYAKRNFSDYLYYFVLDGLMMFSGLLMVVCRI